MQEFSYDRPRTPVTLTGDQVRADHELPHRYGNTHIVAMANTYRLDVVKGRGPVMTQLPRCATLEEELVGAPVYSEITEVYAYDITEWSPNYPMGSHSRPYLYPHMSANAQPHPRAVRQPSPCLP